MANDTNPIKSRGALPQRIKAAFFAGLLLLSYPLAKGNGINLSSNLPEKTPDKGQKKESDQKNIIVPMQTYELPDGNIVYGLPEGYKPYNLDGLPFGIIDVDSDTISGVVLYNIPESSPPGYADSFENCVGVNEKYYHTLTPEQLQASTFDITFPSAGKGRH